MFFSEFCYIYFRFLKLIDFLVDFFEFRIISCPEIPAVGHISNLLKEIFIDIDFLADLVKFAKEQPLPLENDQSLGQCIDFVRETKPRKEPEPVQPEKVENVEQNIVK